MKNILIRQSHKNENHSNEDTNIDFTIATNHLNPRNVRVKIILTTLGLFTIKKE